MPKQKLKPAPWPTWYTLAALIGLIGSFISVIAFLGSGWFAVNPENYQFALGWALFFAILALWSAWQDHKKRAC
jgi:hypothetical protein